MAWDREGVSTIRPTKENTLEGRNGVSTTGRDDGKRNGNDSVLKGHGGVCALRLKTQRFQEAQVSSTAVL